MKKYILSIGLLFIFGQATAQTLVANPQNDDLEGGELKLMNSNANYNPWQIDNYAGNLRFFHSGSVKFYMNSDGKLGLGLLNPTHKLAINSGRKGLKVDGDLGGTNYTDHQVEFLFTDGGTLLNSGIRFNRKNGALDFDLMNTYFNGNELFVIKSNGQVGIGTTSPDSKLTVNGNIHAEEVKVDLSVPGPDYVFKEGYNLRSLEAVQNYIQEHGHLPNIPSAKEMEINGVDLGIMNMKLLEKIEELTLYILEQEQKLLKLHTLEKEIKDIRKLVSDLKVNKE